jgi:hypothetical protein
VDTPSSAARAAWDICAPLRSIFTFSPKFIGYDLLFDCAAEIRGVLLFCRETSYFIKCVQIRPGNDSFCREDCELTAQRGILFSSLSLKDICMHIKNMKIIFLFIIIAFAACVKKVKYE